MKKREWQTSTVVFLVVIIVALSFSLYLALDANLRDSQSIACKNYQYDTDTQRICLIPEEELVK